MMRHRMNNDECLLGCAGHGKSEHEAGVIVISKYENPLLVFRERRARPSLSHPHLALLG